MTAQHCTATEFGRVHVGAEGIRCSTECHVDVQLSAALSVETRERGRSTMRRMLQAAEVQMDPQPWFWGWDSAI